MSHFTRNWVWVVMVSAIGLLLGCSGDDVSTPAERPSSEIRGSSLIKNGDVSVYTYNGQKVGSKGTALATSNTIDTGGFTLDLKANNTPILVCISQGQYLEMARNLTISMNLDDELCAVENYATGQALDIAVNVYTHLAYGLSVSLIADGSTVSSAVDMANQRVDALFGLEINHIAAVDISSASSQTPFATDRHIVGFANAAVSQTMIDIAAVNNSTDLALYNSVTFSNTAFNDITADGLLNGKGAGGQALSIGKTVIDVETYRHNLVLDLYASVNADYNKTGLPGKAIKQMADALNNSTDAMFGDRPTLALDSAPTITSTTDTTIQYKGNAEFSFTVVDPYSIDNVIITFKGAPLTYSVTNGVYTVLIDTNQYPDGVYALEVSATNIYGSTSVSTNNIEAFNTPASTITGTAFDGLILNGNVKVFNYANGIKGSELASTTTDLEGLYSLEILSAATPILIEVTGGRYHEEASNSSVVLQTSGNQKLRAVAMHVPGITVDYSLTTWTNIAAGLAEYRIKGGFDAATAIYTSNLDISEILGFDILKTIPTPINVLDPNGFTGLTNELKYGILAGGVSQWTLDESVKTTTVPHETYNSIVFSVNAYEDIVFDGLLNGIGSSGNLQFANNFIDANTYRNSLAIGIVKIINSENNKTGAGVSDVLTFTLGINNSTNSIFDGAPIKILGEGGPTVSNFTPGENEYMAGDFIMTAEVSDELGVVKTEWLISGSSVGEATNATFPSYSIISNQMDDCKCLVTIRSTNSVGITSDSNYYVQIDNQHFVYSVHQQPGDVLLTFDVYAYNVTGNRDLTLIDNVSPVPTQYLYIHPNGKYAYGNSSVMYSLNPITGKLEYPVTTIRSPFNHPIFNKAGDRAYAYESDPYGTIGSIGYRTQAIDVNGYMTDFDVPFDIGQSYILILHPTLNYAYISTGNPATLTKYDIDSEGRIKEATVPSIVNIDSAAQVIGKNGLYMYVGNTAQRTLEQYRINSSNGNLTLVDSFASQSIVPSNLTIDEQGKNMYVNDWDNGRNISIYGISQINGSLSLKSIVPVTPPSNTTYAWIKDIVISPDGKTIMFPKSSALVYGDIAVDGTISNFRTIDLVGTGVNNAVITRGSANAP